MRIVSFGCLVILFCVLVTNPTMGYGIAEPSRGLISGNILDSNYIAPTGTILERPAVLDEEQQGVQVTDHGDDFVIIGKKQFESGNYLEALTAFDNAIKTNPENAVAWNGKMSALLNLDRYDEVLDIFNDAQKKIPNEFGIWVNRGLAEYYLNEYDKAIQSANHAIKLNPESVEGLALIADCYIAHNNLYEKAINEYEKVLGIDPGHIRAWNNKGYALIQLGKYEEALEALEEALIIDQEYAIAWTNKGDALMGLGQYNEAIKAYKRAINIDPENAIAWNNKGYALNQIGQYQEAIEVLDKALKIDPEFAYAWNNKGYALNELERYEEAIKALDKAINNNPEYPNAWNNIGYALNELGRYEEAIKAYDKALKIDPEYKQAKENREIAIQNQKGVPLFTAKISATPVPSDTSSQNQIISDFTSFRPSAIPCHGNTKCGNNCCKSDEGCCHTFYGPVCYDPYTQICTSN